MIFRVSLCFDLLKFINDKINIVIVHVIKNIGMRLISMLSKFKYKIVLIIKNIDINISTPYNNLSKWCLANRCQAPKWQVIL